MFPVHFQSGLWNWCVVWLSSFSSSLYFWKISHAKMQCDVPTLSHKHSPYGIVKPLELVHILSHSNLKWWPWSGEEGGKWFMLLISVEIKAVLWGLSKNIGEQTAPWRNTPVRCHPKTHCGKPPVKIDEVIKGKRATNRDYQNEIGTGTGIDMTINTMGDLTIMTMRGPVENLSTGQFLVVNSSRQRVSRKTPLKEKCPVWVKQQMWKCSVMMRLVALIGSHTVPGWLWLQM